MKIDKLFNTKIGKLLIIELAEPIYKNGRKFKTVKCLCDCGNFKIVRSDQLTGKRPIQSCGCFATEQRQKQASILIEKNRKFPPKTSCAKAVWRQTYNDGISFEDFLMISQKNCFYCNTSPSNKYILPEWKNTKMETEQNIFIFSGLDRIDSNFDHRKSNVVSCCKYCNVAKSNISFSDFQKYTENLINFNIENTFEQHRYLSSFIDIEILNNKNYSSLLTSIKVIFAQGVYPYNNGDLTLNQFYQLSQMNCFYCNKGPANKANNAFYQSKIKHRTQHAIDTGWFIYNGLDRIDSDQPHNYNNVVACCKICNYAKSNRPLNEFISWISKLKENYINWQNFNGIC